LASKHKVSPERFRHLSHLIQVATKTQDWNALKRYDLQLRELLTTHRPYLNDPRLAPEINKAKEAHKNAFEALEAAAKEVEGQLKNLGEQREGALAYQLAMSLE
jgi:predicted DsbA family dithiol-disulfide isomerase